MKEKFKKVKLLLMCLVCMLVVTGSNSESVMAASKKSITLNKKSATIEVGKTTKIKVEKVKGLKNKKVTYKSSNKSVATVNKNGVVTGKKNGSAVITVTSKADKKVKAKVKVKVVTDFFKANNVKFGKLLGSYKQKGFVNGNVYEYAPERAMFDAVINGRVCSTRTCPWNSNFDWIYLNLEIKNIPEIDGISNIWFRYGLYDKSGKMLDLCVDPGDEYNYVQPSITYKTNKQAADLTYYRDGNTQQIALSLLLPKGEEVYFRLGGYDSIEHYQDAIADGSVNSSLKGGYKLKKEDLHKTDIFFKISAKEVEKALKK